MEENSFEGLSPWQLAIIHDFPEVYLRPSPPRIKRFEESGKPLPEKFCSLRYGFECSSGWEQLIRKFSRVADLLLTDLKRFGAQPDVWISPFCIKEKLGLLQLWADNNLKSPYRELLVAYEMRLHNDSGHVCQVSGEFGKMREVANWFIVLSDAEYEKALRLGLPRNRK